MPHAFLALICLGRVTKLLESAVLLVLQVVGMYVAEEDDELET